MSLAIILAFIAGNVDTRMQPFASVYNSEKSKFTGVRKAYATQNASEYFAESVLEYTENPSATEGTASSDIRSNHQCTVKGYRRTGNTRS